MKKISRRRFIKKSIFIGSGIYLLPSLTFCSGNNHYNQSANLKNKSFIPGYKKLELAGQLSDRVEAMYAKFKNCSLCPRNCGVNRIKGETGVCKATSNVKVATAYPHFGEERALVGKRGSGTIFFSNCNLRCVFCINYKINHLGYGKNTSDNELAEMMLNLQKKGCKNINLVTPTHYAPNIVNAVQIACKKGLSIPLVYNTSGYEQKEILKLLEGIVDIYLPDLKYMENKNSGKYSSGAFDYPKYATTAIKEMHGQVGDLITDQQGNAVRGLMIRHLVMPNNIANTDKVVKWIAKNLGKNTYVNIMAQYRPTFKAFDYPKISRRITRKEFKQAIKWAKEAGLSNLDKG